MPPQDKPPRRPAPPPTAPDAGETEPRGQVPTSGSEEPTRPADRRPAARPAPRPPSRPPARAAQAPPESRDAVPAEPRAAPTGTQRVVASLQRPWVLTVACVAVSATCAYGAWWLYQNGHPILAGLSGLVVVPVLLAAFFIRRAPCPRCGNLVTIIGIAQCEHCREYLRIDGSAVTLVTPGYIADFPTFELNVPLPLVPRLTFPEGICCVCGGLPFRNEILEVQQSRITVSHCDQHEKGVAWALGIVSEAVPTVTFKFKSFDYWRSVRQANWVHVRAGMWR